MKLAGFLDIFFLPISPPHTNAVFPFCNPLRFVEVCNFPEWKN